MPFNNGGECCTCGLGRCFGTAITVHWTLWFNWAFQVVFAVIQYSNSWKYILVIATVWGPVAIFIFLFHELGHIMRNRSFGGTCDYSMLWPLGGFNNCSILNGTCLQEFWVSLCGPLMHIPQFCLWVLIMGLSAPNGVNYYGTSFDINEFDDGGADQWFAQLSKQALDINIMVFVINMLLPAYPMDCASMVAALCVYSGLSVETTGFVLVIIGCLLGLAMLIYGIISLVSGSGPGLFLLLIGLFVLYTSWSMYSMVKAKTIRNHPIFQPDCYRGRSQADGTNLSNAPRQGGGSNNNRNNSRPSNQRDVETGNAPKSQNYNENKNPSGGGNKKPSGKQGSQKRPAPNKQGSKKKPPNNNNSEPKGSGPKKPPPKSQNNNKKPPAKKSTSSSTKPLPKRGSATK